MSSDQQDQLPLFAVIDLGSNSFHMLITRLVADSVQVVDKVKRKVRLASGLNDKNHLSEDVILRGLECLSFFTERLQDIPDSNIRIVATATLRIATNAQDFLQRAEKILKRKITLLSGTEEAENIYLGVAHTNCSAAQRLVLDIGGASTEIIVGEAFKTKKVLSLDIGCVSFNQKFFNDSQLSNDSFLQALSEAKTIISPHVNAYTAIGWQSVLGGSGTMQALAEILMVQKKPAIITLNLLKNLQQQLISFKKTSAIDIDGLSTERVPVFASGLIILRALFECFAITQLQLSSGALREGLLYEMLPSMRDLNIRQRTISSLSQRFHIDTCHASRVAKQGAALYKALSPMWAMTDDNAEQLLSASCALHEIGLLLEYKHHPKHGAYIIQQADLPGFEQAERQLLSVLIGLYKADIDIKQIHAQCAYPFEQACRLLAILRLAVILCKRRRDDVLPAYSAKIVNNTIHLCIPKTWLDQHPLIEDELKQEHGFLQVMNLSLTIDC